MKKRDLSKRVHLMDETRGISILLMVLYHGAYDLVAIFGVEIPLFYSPPVRILAVFFAGLFLFISGAACHFSRSNLRRGALCFGLGMVLTLVTRLFMPTELIRFGILHLLGCCMLLFPLFAPLIRRIHPLVGIAGCLLLFGVTYTVPRGSLCGVLPLPALLYETGWLFWLGFPSWDFCSADYFPLIPWFFCFGAGAFFGRPLAQKRLPPWVYAPHCRFLAFVGRNTLPIYLLHQPVTYGLLLAVFALLRR